MKKLNFCYYIFSGVLLLVLVSCSISDGFLPSDNRILAQETITPSPTPTPLGGETETPDDLPGQVCETSRYNQVSTRQSKLDTLLVLDASGSMKDFRTSLASQFSNFTNVLKAQDDNLDLRVGVLLAWSTQGPNYWSGRLYNAPTFNCTNSPSHSRPAVIAGFSTQAQNDLSCILTSMNSNINVSYDEERILDITNGEGEAAFISTQNLLKDSNFSAAKEQDFFRDDAALSVIFASDENEICSLRPAATFDQQLAITTEYPANDMEYNFLKQPNNPCTGISPASTYNALKSKVGSRALTIGAIVRTQMTNPGGTYNKHFGNGYVGDSSINYKGIVELASSFGFAAELLTDAASVAAALAGIGEATAVSLNKQTQFQLPNNARVIKSVKVNNNEVSSYSFISETRVIDVPSNNAGITGDVVSIRWCDK